MTGDELNQVMVTYNDYLSRMTVALQHLSEDLQDSDYQQAGLVIPAVIEGLEWLYEAAEGFNRMQKIPVETFAAFQEQLKNMAEAFENKDYSLLRDLIEYELLPLMAALQVEF